MPRKTKAQATSKTAAAPAHPDNFLVDLLIQIDRLRSQEDLYVSLAATKDDTAGVSGQIEVSKQAAAKALRKMVQLLLIEEEHDFRGLEWTPHQLWAIRKFQCAINDSVVAEAADSTGSIIPAVSKQIEEAVECLREVFDLPSSDPRGAWIKYEAAWHPEECAQDLSTQYTMPPREASSEDILGCKDLPQVPEKEFKEQVKAAEAERRRENFEPDTQPITFSFWAGPDGDEATLTANQKPEKKSRKKKKKTVGQKVEAKQETGLKQDTVAKQETEAPEDVRVGSSQ